MDVIGVVARANSLSADALVRLLDEYAVAPVLGSVQGAALPLARRCLLTWMLLYLGSLLMYFAFAGIDFLVVFVLFRERLLGGQRDARPDRREMRREMLMSSWSLAVMAVLTTPMEVLVQLGYSRVYHDAAQYGALYFVLSPLLFIVFSDSLIYFIHRGLHHRWVYRHLHKPHHSFINTTPFSAFAFHPLDGFAQGVPYQLFVFVFPFHGLLHLVSLAVVGMWTINIHDRVTLGIPGVNGAAHHRIHHVTFRSNYGQYFTVWDRMFGTHKEPRTWQMVSCKGDGTAAAAAAERGGDDEARAERASIGGLQEPPRRQQPRNGAERASTGRAAASAAPAQTRRRRKV